MARTKISEFSATPANNTDIDSINIAEGCAPSGINDAIRELMAQLKDFQTGAVGDSFNGPVGASTASTGAFTTLSATGAITSTLATGTAPLVIASTTKVANLNADLLDGADWAAPAALGSTTPAAVSATTLAASSTVTLSGGTANGVAYLNGSKVVTSGSALTFDGTRLTSTTGKFGGGAASNSASLMVNNATNTATGIQLFQDGIESWIMGMPANSAGLAWSASGSEQMRLTSTGLGIGTSSPASPLAVAGTASVNWAGAGSSTGTATIGTQGTGGSLLVQTPSVNASYASGFGVDGTYSDGKSVINLKALGTSSGGPYSADMAFFTSTNTTLSEKMRLDSSGNLGLGVTPSAWGSTWKAIQIGMGGSIFARTADQNRIGITANAFFDTAFKYIGTGQATFYDQDDGNHYWYNAPSGTAGNAITFSQAMTLTANGELMVGTTTATGKASIAGAITATASSALVNPSVGVFGLYTGGAIPNTYVQMPSGGSIDFWKADTGVAARIDSSGNWIVGKTSANDTTGGLCYFGASKYLSLVRDNSAPLFINRLSTDGAVVEFARSTTLVGTISVTTTATAYNTSSDYRLKNTIAPMTGALAKVALLKPCTYKWNADGSDGEGFIAHELAEVVPQCVTGQKDAVDEEGNPKYQGIDTSFLVATLTAALQELNAKFDAYVASHP